MLTSIREFFERQMDASAPERDEAHAIRIATAALLVEVVRIDAETKPAESAAVLRAVREKFELSADETEELIRLADEEVRQAGDYYQFTSLINRHFSQPQKQRVIELMWRIAYADGELSAHEHHLMRRIAGLLHVAHGDYIAAKLRASQAAV